MAQLVDFLCARCSLRTASPSCASSACAEATVASLTVAPRQHGVHEDAGNQLSEHAIAKPELPADELTSFVAGAVASTYCCCSQAKLQ